MRVGSIALLVVVCLLVGCSSISASAHSHHHKHHHTAPGPAHGPAAVEWTCLFFINGNNNLDKWGDFNVNQMKTVGSQPWLNLVVQQASLSRNDTQRLFIKKGEAQVVQDLGSGVQMGDVSTWEDFVQWGVTNYPAEHYLLSIWDHGTGWHDIHHENGTSISSSIKAARRPNLGDISCNDDFDRCITTTQLGDALARFNRVIGRKIDIFATDACSMQMIEIAAQFSDYANYYIASEASVPSRGWPYDTWLQQWATAGPAATSKDIASFLTSQFMYAYTSGEYAGSGAKAVTQSFLDLTQIQPVLDGVKTLGQQILAFNQKDVQVAYANIAQSQCYNEPDSCDILSYANLLAQAFPSLQSTVSALDKAVGNMVTQYGGTGKFSASTGVAIWLPDNLDIYYLYDHDTRYEHLRFEMITQWGAALKYMLTGNKTKAIAKHN